MQINDQVAKLRVAVGGFKISQLLMTAQKLGVFKLLTKYPLDGAGIAEKCGANKVHIQRLCNALVANNILDVDHGIFFISEDWSILRDDSSAYQGGYIEYSAIVRDCWSKLTDILVDADLAQQNVSRINGGDREATKAFISAMDANALPVAKYISRNWEFSDRKILDVGGGSGIYTIEVCRKHTVRDCVVFELPGVADLAQSNVEAAGFRNQISVEAGDYNESLPCGQYTDAFLFAVIHFQDVGGSLALLRRAYAALGVRGRIFVTSFFTNDEGTGPTFSAMFGVEMTVMVPGGQIYSHSQITSLLKEAGFGEISRHDDIPGPATLYVARK